MILSQISAYLKRHRRASLVDMAHALMTDPEALKAMLAALERKGWVRRMQSGTPCKGCCKCDLKAVELYEWTGD